MENEMLHARWTWDCATEALGRGANEKALHARPSAQHARALASSRPGEPGAREIEACFTNKVC